MKTFLPGFIATRQQSAQPVTDSRSHRDFLVIEKEQPAALDRLHAWLPLTGPDDHRERMDDLWNDGP